MITNYDRMLCEKNWYGNNDCQYAPSSQYFNSEHFICFLNNFLLLLLLCIPLELMLTQCSAWATGERKRNDGEFVFASFHIIPESTNSLTAQAKFYFQFYV